jgi:chromosome partitioning protein
MVRVLGISAVKGGVGKTTAAVNLSYLAARGGARTLLIDLDPQGAAAFILRVSDAQIDNPGDGRARTTEIARLDVLPAPPAWMVAGDGLDASLPDPFWLRNTLDAVGDWYDEVVLDCPPGLSELTDGIIMFADTLAVPLVPSPLSVRTLEALHVRIRELGGRAPAVYPFFSLADRRRRLHRELIESVQLTRPETLSAPVPYSADVERMGVALAPVVKFAPSCAASQAYESIWRELQLRRRDVPPRHGAQRDTDPRIVELPRARKIERHSIADSG